jgi:peroxiredoxin
LTRFAGADVQVLGISVDSVPCHQAFAERLGGLSYPLLADFHPKGQVAAAYGVYLEERGFAARATIVIGRDGNVKWVKVIDLEQQRRNDEILAAAKPAT